MIEKSPQSVTGIHYLSVSYIYSNKFDWERTWSPRTRYFVRLLVTQDSQRGPVTIGFIFIDRFGLI